MSAEVWTVFSPNIVKYVETLLKECKIGICSGTIRILDVGTSCSSLNKGPCADRCKLAIPYAGQSITWEILFDCHHPTEPPDFVFGAEDNGFMPSIDDIQGLVQWCWEDEKSLSQVVLQLLAQYKTYQQSLISNHSRLQFEYSSLIDQGGLKAADVEVHVRKKPELKRMGPVNFLIKLPIDFSKIPAYLVKDDPGEDSAVLLVTFETPDTPKGTPQLFLSPRVELSLGGSAGLRIPVFPTGGCLLDYVPNVCDLLKNKVDQVVNSYEKRKEYIGAFLSHYGRMVVEYDPESFNRISFLMNWHDFFFIITIDLPGTFPIEQPMFNFQSVYHEAGDGRPFVRVVKDYPYSPRWTGNEMAERARAFILEYISSFQSSSVKDGSL